GHPPHPLVQEKTARLKRSAKPDARPDTPTASLDSFLGEAPFVHRGPSPSSSARRQTLPPTVNDHPGFGAARRRPFQPRIAVNEVAFRRPRRERRAEGNRRPSGGIALSVAPGINHWIKYSEYLRHGIRSGIASWHQSGPDRHVSDRAIFGPEFA